MKHQLLFIQGGGAGTHDEWDDKLVDGLRRGLGADYEVRYPRMPDESEPNAAKWKGAIENELGKLGDGAILVGHSIGATILLNTVAEWATGLSFRGIFLLSAPFVGEGGWPSDGYRSSADLGVRMPPGIPIHFFHGGDDETAPIAHADLYARAIPQARVHRLPGRDHQLGNDVSEVCAAIRALDREA
ncbi:MAG TPA: alpha/beta fold hydrolase [Polyangia bacterium]